MRFRKKPVEIEAVYYGGEAFKNDAPKWLFEALGDGTLRFNGEGTGVEIKTLEGVMIASPGDWIIRGIVGEIYPCKPDIFAKTYDPA